MEAKGRRAKRQFTDEFKAGAVRLVLDEGKTVAQAARDLGLTASSLRVWVERARADRTGGKSGLTTDERAEMAALRKEVRTLRMERDILRKAPRFSQDLDPDVPQRPAARKRPGRLLYKPILQRDRRMRCHVASRQPRRHWLRASRVSWGREA